MKNALIILVSTLGMFVSSANIAFSQSTFGQVYSILNSATCGSGDNSCHSSSASSELAFDQNEAAVYNQLYYQLPENTIAASNGDFLVLPGNPYRSFLFKKVNQGLAGELSLGIGEGEPMPNGAAALTDKERELIRQWIMYGAPQTGEVVDMNLINEYYDNGGLESVSNPPTPPPLGEGFQLHLGPIFLPPLGESPQGGHYSRFDMNFADTVEATRVESIAGDGVHHTTLFIYNDENNIPNVPYGVSPLSNLPELMSMEILATYQQAVDALELPEGAAYQFPKNSPLIFNSHYFNPSLDLVRKCDTYFNVYTQPKNTANQVMRFGAHEYYSNPNDPNNNNPPLYIPADQQPYTFQEFQYVPGSQETRYLWAMIAHVHEYCTGYKVYRRTPSGDVGEPLADVSCINGIPGCSFPYFDPWHIPTRYFDSFEAIPMNEGFFHQATYVNTTNEPITYGPSAFGQEMMVFGYYYVEDTTGVFISGNQNPSSIDEETVSSRPIISLYPNPFNESIRIELNSTEANVKVDVFSSKGKLVHAGQINRGVSNTRITSQQLSGPGIYIVKCVFNDGSSAVKRVVLTD